MTLPRIVAPKKKSTYAYWRAFYAAFYQRSLYVDVFKRWKGLGLTYFFLMVLVFSLPFSLRTMVALNRYINDEWLYPLQHFPTLTVSQGAWSITEPLPYLIQNKQGVVVAVLTHEGAFETWQRRYSHLTMLLTREQMMFRFPPLSLFFMHTPLVSTASPSVESLAGIRDDVFEAKTWVTSQPMVHLKWITLAMVYPLLALLFFGFFVPLMLGLGVLGQVLAKVFFHMSMSYAAACRLMMVASTVSISGFFVLTTLNLNLPTVSYVVLLAIYDSYAVSAVRRDARRDLVA